MQPGRPANAARQADASNYGPGWRAVQRLVRDRDRHTCRACGKRWEPSMRRFPVAHLTPLASWPVEARRRVANHPTNLILLCESCHSRFDNRADTRWDYQRGLRETWPSWTGHRVEDIVSYCREMLAVYGDDGERGRYADLASAVMGEAP